MTRRCGSSFALSGTFSRPGGTLAQIKHGSSDRVIAIEAEAGTTNGGGSIYSKNCSLGNSGISNTVSGTDPGLIFVAVEDSSEEILGRPTRLVTIEYDDGSVDKYWFDPRLYIDPAPYHNLRFASLNRYWQEAKAPPLKYERVTELVRVIRTATKISPGSVPETVFEIPG